MESRPQPVGDIVSSDKEEPIDLMTEIVPVIKKPAPASGAASVAASAAPEPVFGFEIEAPPKNEEEVDLFDLLQDDDDDDDDAGDSAPNSAQGGGGGAAAGKPKSAAAAADKPESEGEEEDLSDITGMELANPNPFSKRIQERDPVIHLNEDVGKFNAYSRSCPWNVRRQPVILTSEEKARIDREHPGSYTHSITYGSDASKPYHYICPRYWSLKHNTSLTEEEVKSGKYGAVIPQKAKKIPAGANIFEFTDDKYHVDEKGNYKQHYPGFLKKDAHPKGLCVPCCFAQWDKPAQTARRQECEAKQFEAVKLTTRKSDAVSSSAATAAATEDATEAAAGGSDEVPSISATPGAAAAAAANETPRVPHVMSFQQEPVKINEMKDDRILSADKFPLENGRFGYLPTQLQKFLFTDSRNCQVSLKNAAIKKDTPCLIRRGVETNERQSFVSAIAYYYKESISTEKTTATLATGVPVGASFGASVGESSAASTPRKSNLQSALQPLMISGDSTKTDILKRVTDTIQKNASVLSKRVSASAVTATAAAPDSSVFAPRGAEAGEAAYGSDEETPVAMTPRPSGSAAAAAAARGSQPIMWAPSLPARDSEYIPTIREMRSIIIQSLDVDTFRTLQNGTIVDSFYNPENEMRESDMMHRYSTAEISRTLPKQTFARICNAYENFIAYLDDDTSVIDHTYLWDIISRPNERLFKHGNNIILLHIPDDDITNNVQVICPTNAYSGEVFDVNRKTIIIMKRDSYYEPIFLFESKSSGKFSVLGRFALKSKTLLPKMKHIIETVRDLYFAYCRLHASQPREYKYKMNLPALVISKILREAGFTIHAQVMNYNGKVIGLQISQTISKLARLDPSQVTKKTYKRTFLKGVIPTAVSAPLEQDGGSGTGTGTGIPTVLMNDESLWEMSYHETVNFLKEVQQHVKKTTKKEIYCLPRVKVVEEGLIVGVITETNQFLQVNVENDPQMNYNDDLPTITEGNHLRADEVVETTPTDKMADKTRERYVRNIRLETNFYNVFRNTARNVLNRPENKAVKDTIEKIIGASFVIYNNKLSQIITIMKKLLSKHVSFIRYSKDTLKMVGEVSGCITSDDETCGKKSYCLKELGGMCKLLLPQRNLMLAYIDNEVAYFGKLADEMIRYERVRLFMFEPMKYPTFQDIKYNLRENEIILLETFITQDYFENMEPADANPYIHQTNFYTVAPSNAGNRGIQHYDPTYHKEYVERYFELETGVKRAAKIRPSTLARVEEMGDAEAEAEAEADGKAGSGAGAAAAGSAEMAPDVMRSNEIDHVLDFCQEVSKRKITIKLRNAFFPKMNTFELLFSNESNECSFDLMLTILRSMAQTASKCPSGHSCVAKTSTSTRVGTQEPEPEVCAKCQTNIGIDQSNFACRQCNYFMCDNCRTQHLDQYANMTVAGLKDILVTEYAKLARNGLEKKLTMILNGYGMKQYADIINEGRATLAQIIQSENYFLTNFDVWLLAVYFKIPMVFVSQTLLSENGKSYMVLFGDEMTDSYFFIQTFQVVQGVPSRFGLIEIRPDDMTSMLKIPLSFVSSDLQEGIRREHDMRISLEDYIREFKLLNIKKKKRVFTMMDKQNK